MVRLKNKKFLEDGLFEVVVVPYSLRDPNMPDQEMGYANELQPPAAMMGGAPPAALGAGAAFPPTPVGAGANMQGGGYPS